MKSIAILVLALCSASSFATIRYVSPTGVDTDPGSFSQPYRTITKAVGASVAGDTIYLRGGNHTYSTKISISKIGTTSNRFYLLAYPGEKPVLDFSAMAFSSSNRGLELSGQYWTIRGIDFYKAGDNGMFISGAFNIIDLCNFYENQDTGLQLANGANNNRIINCDSYFNIDPSQGNADGFAAKLDVGTGNSFKGCRAWQNSDDGWDGLLTAGLGTNPATTYDSCWCFMNGYLKSGAQSLGNGNGFKMGGNQELHDATLTRCLSAFNRVKGFDQNNDKGSMILYNCTSYKNGTNFGMNNYDPAAGKVMIIKNCISFAGTNADAFRSVAERANNSWQSPFVTNAADFVSIDSLGLRSPRNADGSLPNINFMKLATGSDLINGGVDVGLPYAGTAPDLGAFETSDPLPVTLLSFTGALVNQTAVLSWKAATQTQNMGWEIERSSSNGVWVTLGFVNGAYNTTITATYTFSDASITVGTTYQYRLKQIDADGHFVYSDIVVISGSGALKKALLVYPNPVQLTATMMLTLPKMVTIELQVYNSQGQAILKLPYSKLGAGSHVLTLNTATWQTGNYWIRIVADGTVIANSQLVKL